MRSFLLLFSLVVLISCNRKTTKEEQLIVDRISFIYNLKSTVNKTIWKDFDQEKFDLPLVYYTTTATYIANPTNRFLEHFESDLVFENEKLKIYKSRMMVDSIPFHMEAGLTFGDSTSDYNYKSPFMNCSSLEITQTKIPQVHGTEQWATMVLHEYFHGFQYKHNNYLKEFEKYSGVPEDSLKRIYKNKEWFKESVIKENELLLSALNETSGLETKKLIVKFFALRKERRLRVQQELMIDLEPIENIYETMEGTARYMEYGLFKAFSDAKPDARLIVSDTAFHSFTYFRNYNIEKDTWLYKSGSVAYFYASGFNIVRLLDKLDVEYKSRLFNEGETSLEELLKEGNARSFKSF